MPPNNEPLIYRHEGEIAFTEINRPEKKNALNYECWLFRQISHLTGI